MKILAQLLLLVTLVGCSDPKENKPLNSQELNQMNLEANQFMPEWVYTTGIEGPALDGEKIFIVNYEKEGTIGVTDLKGNSKKFIDLPIGSTGNAIQFYSGYMFVADYTGHQILKIDTTTKDISTLLLVDEMNQPNDFTVSDNGIFYLSDPNWNDSTGNLWMHRNDSTWKIDANVGTTNGIVLNPSQNILYYNESIQRKVWKYDLDNAGIPTDRTLFYEFKDGGLDGMKCDTKGNLWIARYDMGEIAVLKPNGELSHIMKLKGKKPTNLILIETKELVEAYVTMQDRGCVEKINYSKIN